MLLLIDKYSSTRGHCFSMHLHASIIMSNTYVLKLKHKIFFFHMHAYISNPETWSLIYLIEFFFTSGNGLQVTIFTRNYA